MKRKVLSSLLAVMLVLQVFLPNFIVSASTVNNEIIGEQNDQEKQMNSEVDPIDEIIEDDSLGDVKTENNISEDDSKKEDTVTEEPVSKESEETEKSESTTQNNQESKNNEETDNDTIIENTENTEDIQEIKPDVQMKSMFNSNQSSYQAVLNGDVGSNKTTPLLGAPQKDGQVITQLPWRGTVTAQDYNADYKSVSAVINGKTYTGFVESKYVQRFVTSTSKENAISKNNNLKIYQYPSTLSRVVHTYSKSGSSMEIYKVTDYWYEVHVNINGEKVIGYTDQNSFEKIKPDIKYQVVLNGDVGPNDETPVYKSPNSTSGTWKHYPWRSVLELREYTDGWYFINFQINGKWEKGYIEAKYVQKFITSDKEENVVTSKKNVTLFSRPSTLSVKLKTFPNQGAPLTVKKITDYWYETQVIVNGKSQKAYLDVNSFETEKIKPDIKYQVVLNGDVGPNKETPVYKSPNTSAGTWKNYPWRAVLELREYTDNWYFINFQINGKWEKGYIEAKYVQKFITSDKEEDVITSKKNVTLYSRPSTLSVNLQTFPNSGTPFKVKKITDYWYETQAVVDGKTQKAYLDVNSFEKIKPDTKYQIVLNGDLGPNDETPVYKSPNTSSGTWKKYPWRAVLELREYTDNWYFINFRINGKWEKGYIEAKYVQKFITSKTEETVVTSKNNVITYSRPSTLGVKLETYSKAGSVLKVNKITDYWYETKVKVNGKEEKGYLSSNQFKKIPVEYQTKSYNLTLNDAVNIQMRLTNPPPMTDLRLMSSNLLRNNDVDLSYNIGNGAPAALNIQPFSFNSATRDQVKQYMDPNNFKTTDISYYQFLKLGTPTQLNEKEVNDVILKGKGVLQGKAASFIQAGKNHSINEAYLISHALLETGNGQSNLATGVKIVVDSKNQFVRVANASDKNTKTVYNMYGIGAIDNNALVGGARTAWNNGWTSVDSAIIGGAKFVSNNYIHAGQDTLYKMRWNPNAMEKYGYATHQYASDIAWAVKQTTRMADMYAQLTKYKLVFEVPKYK